MGSLTLSGRTALVTGAGRGIGRAIAIRLAGEGALVTVHYGRNTKAADEVVTAIRAAGGSAFALRAELGEPGDVEALWDGYDRQVVEHTDDTGLDILVNNAGINVRCAIGDTSPETFDEMFAVNVRAPFFVAQRALERMRDGGRIVNVSSGAARMAFPEITAYSMTKGAIDTFSRTLAQALGPRGITVNSVSPGIVDTDINAAWLRGDEEVRQAAAEVSALGRIGRPEDVADVVAFLTSDAARWVTGQVIDASGGSRL
ncbi:glucose 1-dehydrogenase [Streptomyces clavuligerus]|uniref:Short-chain dehydrogenase/reductase SDR n=1 Tax=Streptomyces clavuligerus TaxID=1901 RepID=B5GMZ7_STRCL|nr:glucose 1-dehydrogenase [Streptomyces clavuligerus]ANW22246.1 short-chain dehydrogenase [Streptomyces clavuligerus]AXU17141.1 SDR family oxidoreductase [Streptomyces clavuligerus]EDY47693.1 oxidoreductase [Streptomyces clavuligerus]EFG04314.1 Short-chain dehydrogenase/reductase SDR [Streptomyces clavuligerus]MBY6307212.1 glucose 1-dehydrogenase [Streptomyces clavuligerus]